MAASTVTQYENLEGEEKYLVLMGRNVPMIHMEEMMKLWQISGSFISMIYRKTVLQIEIYALKTYRLTLDS